MDKHSVNFVTLADKVYKRKYLVSEVADRIEKVAFDIVKFKESDDRANLWQVVTGEDGNQYIISRYDNADDVEKTATASVKNPWSVHKSSLSNKLDISYKNEYIASITASHLGIKEGELNKVASYLPNSLNENKKLVSALLNDLGMSAKKDLVSKYPELG